MKDKKHSKDIVIIGTVIYWFLRPFVLAWIYSGIYFRKISLRTRLIAACISCFSLDIFATVACENKLINKETAAGIVIASLAVFLSAYVIALKKDEERIEAQMSHPVLKTIAEIDEKIKREKTESKEANDFLNSLRKL